MIDFYTENYALKAPGFAIHGASSPTVKTTNTFDWKQNGLFSAPLTTADWVSLATAEGPGDIPPGNLSDQMCRIYTFLISFDPATGVVTKSVVCSADFTKSRFAGVEDVSHGNPENLDFKKAIVGTLYIKNESGADFVPGTTNLDASGITTVYHDVWIAVGA